MKWKVFFSVLLIRAILAAFTPSPAELNVQAAPLAADISATPITATPTLTPTVTLTATEALTPTATHSPVPFPPTQSAPTWSPDGRQMAFVGNNGNEDIYVMNLDGSGLLRLTDDPAPDRSPVWSLDGQRIAFVSEREGNQEIYVMNADGSSLTRLTDTPTSEWAPDWSPDGMQIAFGSERDGNEEIYVMNPDGSGLLRLTDDPAYDGSPIWSPDGGQIAFVSRRDGDDDIYVMNADGSNLTRLTDNTDGDWIWDWSPNGQQIGFQSNRDDNNDIYLMNTECVSLPEGCGSGLIRLTNDPAWDGALAWSPDGRQIAFSSIRDGFGIYIMNVECISLPEGCDSGVTRLSNDASGLPPVWSPDGRQIAFEAGPVDYPEVYVMNANGSELKSLSELQGPESSPTPEPLGPIALTIQDDFLWVANITGNNVMKLRLADGAVVGKFPVAGRPVALLTESEFLWIATVEGNEVVKLRLEDGSEVGRFAVGQAPVALAVDDEFLWVANCGSNNVTKLHLSDGAIVDTFPAGSCPDALVVEGDSIWVFNQGSDDVWRMQRSDGAIVGKYLVAPANFRGVAPKAAILAGDSLWVATTFGLTRLRVSDGSLVGQYPTDYTYRTIGPTTDNANVTFWGAPDPFPASLAVAGDFLWLTEAANNTVTKLSLADGSVVGTYSVAETLGPANPVALAVHGDFLWVANLAGDEVVKLRLTDGAYVARLRLADGAYIETDPSGSASSSTNGVALIPDVEIPDGLFLPEAGASNFDEDFTGVLYSKGDWILTRNIESILPIPSGWTTFAPSIHEIYIFFSPNGDLEHPAIQIRKSYIGRDVDADTSEELLAEIEKAAKSASVSILKKEIIDANKGYIFASIETETGEKRYFLRLLSKYDRNPSGEFFHDFSVSTDQEDWATYYPIIQAMVEHWRALDGTPLGVTLPDTLVE